VFEFAVCPASNFDACPTINDGRRHHASAAEQQLAVPAAPWPLPFLFMRSGNLMIKLEIMTTVGTLARSSKWRKVILGQRWYEDWEVASNAATISSPLALNWVMHCKGRDPALLLKGSLGGLHLDAGFRRQQVPQKWWRLFWQKTQYGAVVSPAAPTSNGKDYYELYLPQRSNDGSKLLDAVVSCFAFLPCIGDDIQCFFCVRLMIFSAASET